MTRVFRYRFYGLTIDSDVELDEFEGGPRYAGAADLTFRRGESRVVGTELPDGPIVLSFTDGNVGYALVANENGYLLRFFRTLDVEIAADLSSVTLHLAAGADPGMLAVLIVGATLAVILELRGALILHASAVVFGDLAYAFVGASGMGKSTSAALICRDGGMILTDDVLRVQCIRGDGAYAFAGSSSLRLRTGAFGLAASMADVERRDTADGRTKVKSHADVDRDRLYRLRALVIPQPTEGLDAPVVERLTASNGLGLLGLFPRLTGWRARSKKREQFDALTALATEVPVVKAFVPWDLSGEGRIGAALIEAINGSL